MRVLPILLCGLSAAAVWAQGESVSERVRRALAASGQAELALADISQRKFAPVQEMLVKRTPADPAGRSEIHSLEGVLAFLAGDMSSAIDRFTVAAALAPLRDSDTFTFAMAFVKLGKNEEARSRMAELTRRNPGRSIYLYWLGRIDYDGHRYEQSAEELQGAVGLDPASARAWDSLGLAFDMQGKMEQAQQAFTKSVELNRNASHPSAWPAHDLGHLLLRLNQPKESEAMLRESLRYDPKLAQAHYHLARALEKEGQNAEAVGEYRAAIASEPSSDEPYYSLGLLYRKLQQDTDAAAMFAEYRKRKKATSSESHQRAEEP